MWERRKLNKETREEAFEDYGSKGGSWREFIAEEHGLCSIVLVASRAPVPEDKQAMFN